MKPVSAFVIGLVFGLGLIVSGMGNPEKVLNFFDLFGTFDPSLLFVMGAALITTAVGYRLVFRANRPVLADRFRLPSVSGIDVRLIAGSSVFGIGWGLTGFCPGAIAAVLATGMSGPILAAIGAVAGAASVRVASGALPALGKSAA